MSTTAYAPTATYPATYAPAAATATGYQQYAQYAHSPQYHGAQLSQVQYIQADTNHDGMVSQVEMQAAQPVHHGLFGNHHGLGIYDHFVNHGAGGAQLAAQAGQSFTYAPATVSGYQQFSQYAQSPQYHGAHLTQAQYMQADANHDGRISMAEIEAAAMQQPAPVYHQPATFPATYAPAAATTTGYQQYAQYAHSPQYHGAQLTQAQYLHADTNHDGKVSMAEIEAVQHQAPVYHQPATVYHQPSAHLPTAASMVAYPQYTPQYEQYQSQFQFSAAPQLTAQEFAQADSNHDGKVSNQEITRELAAVGKDSKPSKKKVSKKKKKGGCC